MTYDPNPNDRRVIMQQGSSPWAWIAGIVLICLIGLFIWAWAGSGTNVASNPPATHSEPMAAAGSKANPPPAANAPARSRPETTGTAPAPAAPATTPKH